MNSALHLLWRARWFNTDGGHFNGNCSTGDELFAKNTGLIAGSGHQNLPAKQGLGFEPRETITRCQHLTHDDNGIGEIAKSCDRLGHESKFAKRAYRCALIGSGSAHSY